jgi:multiple sugar transport system permease protein
MAATSTKNRKYSAEQLVTAYGFLMPLAAGVVLFFVVPIVQDFYYAFTQWKGAGDAVFIGLGNFKKMFTNDSHFITEIKNTFAFVVGTIPLTIFVALVISCLLNAGIKGVSAYRVIYFLPNITMTAVIAIIWRGLLNSRYGVINTVLYAVLKIRPAWLSDVRLTMASMCMIGIWSGIGYCIVIILAGLQSIDKTYYEAAKIDGANGFQRFFFITFPLVTPSLFFLVIMRTIGAFNQFDFVFLLGDGNYGPVTRSIATLVFGMYQSGFQDFTMGYACAKAVILFFVIMLITIIQLLGEKLWVHY